MVDTIGAVVNGEGRKRAWLAAVLHVVGATMTATLLGAALALIGNVLGAPWGPAGIVVVVALAGLYFLREALHLPVPVPQSKRQVPDWWRSFYTAPIAALMFGAGLGIGFLTFLSYGTFVVVSAAALVSGDPLTGALVCGPFGLARGVAAGAAALGRVDFRSLLHRLEGLGEGPVPGVANALVLGVIVLGGALALA